MYDYVMLFINKDENDELYKHFFKNVWYEVYDTDDALIMKITDDFSNSRTKIIKMICKLEQIKVKEDDWKLLSNSDVAKQKFKKLRKFMQKKGKLKESSKMIQFIEENNNTRTKLIEKLKEKACRTVKEIMTAKSINKENELNDDDDLKNPTSILKSLKNKLEFTKLAVPM